MLGALLAKHGLIPRTVVTNPKKHPFQMSAILAVAGDLLDFLGGGDDELEAAAQTVASAPKPWKGVCSGCGGSGCDDCKWEGTSAAVIIGEDKP